MWASNAQRLQLDVPSPKRLRKSDSPAEDDKSAGKFWAAGTGFGTGGKAADAGVWDAHASEIMQAAQDRELQRLMQRLGGLLSSALHGGDDNATGDSSRAVEEAARQRRAVAVAAVRESCLPAFLARELAQGSFKDMASRAAYYGALLWVLHQLCTPELAATLASAPGSQGVDCGSGSLAAAMEHVALMTHYYLRAVRTAPEDVPPTPGRTPPLTDEAAAAQALAAADGPHWVSPSKPAEKDSESLAKGEEANSLLLAQILVQVARRVKEVAEGVAAAPREALASRPATRSSSRLGAPEASASATAEAGPQAHTAAYVVAMREHQVDMVASMAPHTYSGLLEGVQPRARQNRVGKELASLHVDLPLSYSSSVLVRADEQHMMLWRAMITGPEDTPYHTGCYIFDIYFPPQYPAEAPRVTLLTTGGGRVRFNPNLYNNGKVCLSLLGTWAGGKGEGWDPAASSMLQVLISIQSLILVPQPFFNEPGFEARMHTEAGHKQDRDYSAVIREASMQYAILEQLKHPPCQFEAAVQTHFRMQKATVLQTCESWITETQSFDKARAGRMRGHLASIRELLDQL